MSNDASPQAGVRGDGVRVDAALDPRRRAEGARAPSCALERRTILVGGLGAPYDALLGATLRARGLDARPVGAMDLNAHDRGRRTLSRNPCAPLLYTTGALLRSAGMLAPGASALALGLGTCGPCRFALFAPTWRRALAAAGYAHVHVLSLEQDPFALEALVGPLGAASLLETVAVGDALVETTRRVRPYLEEPDALDAAAERALAAVVRRIESGAPPIAALAEARGFHAQLARRPAAALGRIALIGEPWSLHVDGTPQLHLPRVLSRAGVEVEVPPLSLWLALRAWEARQPGWGARSRGGDAERSLLFEARVRDALGRACSALGLGGLVLPDLDALAELAAPWLASDVRGGYGHVEVALALRARRERRAHAVVSIKSFGCIPSSGVADAIVPVALAHGARAMPFLSLEVGADGAAARESRLLLRVVGARREAERELSEARARVGGVGAGSLPVVDPLAGVHDAGPRAYACTLACEVARAPREGAA